jgi:hypothetical protein
MRPSTYVSSTGWPCYARIQFLHKILIPLVGKIDSFVKNLEPFIK